MGLSEKRRLIEALKIAVTRRSLSEYLASWQSRTRAFRRRKAKGLELVEGYLPSDELDAKNDVAFGVTKKSRQFLSADMITDDAGKPPRNMGTISHLGLLTAAGLADGEKATDEFAVRGIVKAKLNGRVIFWEDTPTLTSPRYASFVKACIDNLLDRNLIKQEAEVYGADEEVAVATAEEIKRDW
jgi:hypothetical protein